MIPVTQDVLSNILCMDNISYEEQEAEQLCAHKRLMSTVTSLAAVCSSVPGFELSLTPEIKSTLCLVLRGCGRHCGWPHASALLGDFAKPSHHGRGILPYLFRLGCKSSSGSEPVLILQRNPVRFLALTLDGSQLPVIPTLRIWRPLLTPSGSSSHLHRHIHISLKSVFFKKQKCYISSESNSVISPCFGLFSNLSPSPQKAQGHERR